VTAERRGAAMQGFWVAAAVLAILVAPPAASQKAPPVKVSAFDGAAPVLLLREVGQGPALYARKADTAFVPASLVKVLTAYVVLERVRAGQMALDQKVTVPAALVKRWQKWPRASSMRLRAGQGVTVAELLHGMITVSGNDAADLLAITSDGNNADFVARMNRHAQRIGMASSQFGTPTGWPDGGKTKVTANDLARLAERLLRDHPDAYRRYFGTKQLKLGNGSMGANRNPLLARVAGADGLKTGHTSEAGYTLIGSARRDGRRLIVVLAGATSQSQRGREGAALLDAGFDAIIGAGTAQEQKNKP
jgi:serine-type D-Ala-D-Ala carboxypeptidase (penicillin-binding protein 5/6)